MELSVEEIRRVVQAALAEDIGSGDVTTLATVPENAVAKAVMRVRETLTLAGITLAEESFRQISPAIRRVRGQQRGDLVSIN